MATLKITKESVKKVFKRFILDMSKNEAATLLAILNHVGGDPMTSPRCFANDIRHALLSQIPQQLVNQIENCITREHGRCSDSIYFRDNSWDIDKKKGYTNEL